MHRWQAEEKLAELKRAHTYAPVTRPEFKALLDVVEALFECIDEKAAELSRDIDRKQDDPERQYY